MSNTQVNMNMRHQKHKTLTSSGWRCDICRGQVTVAVVCLITASNGHNLGGRGAAAEGAAVLSAKAAHTVVIMAGLHLHDGRIALEGRGRQGVNGGRDKVW